MGICDDYNSTNYKFKQDLEFQTTHWISPPLARYFLDNQGFSSESIVGEIIVNSPYEFSKAYNQTNKHT